ncbi:hypothetical protein CD122_10105 [Staphylococcus rostri]|uniref:Zinc-ribbon domain-containing protein n=1 Tax=Staphylococcus rostri TaxID=522262 RepID=A0A2K3YI96_9STAP|nr:zinc ribbon domain-containing protein [Staphylococcus rostri]PNZ25309.1 hypothetical protein CD122_10105 [Staphylococcus rostri]
MRFCSNCGNEIKGNQKYCNNCGQPVNARSAQYMVVEEKRSVWPWIIGIIGTLILLAGLAFAGLQIYKNITSNQASTQGNSDTPNTALIDPDNQPTAQTSVDVLSQDFSDDYMLTPRTEGYQGFTRGMTRPEVEQLAGQHTDIKSLVNGTVYKYHNIGIYYDTNDEVLAVMAMPDNVSTSEFKQFHGEPKYREGKLWIYDNNPNNEFTIIVHTDGQNVVAVQNMDQVKY